MSEPPSRLAGAFLGHAKIGITLDRYGQLMPGSEGEAAGLLDSYLGAQRERADDAARGAGGVLKDAPVDGLQTHRN